MVGSDRFSERVQKCLNEVLKRNFRKSFESEKNSCNRVVRRFQTGSRSINGLKKFGAEMFSRRSKKIEKRFNTDHKSGVEGCRNDFERCTAVYRGEKCWSSVVFYGLTGSQLF